MIPNGNGINYLAVKKLSALLRGITSKYHGNFCCKDYHYSFAIKNKLKSYECLYENKDFCNISMPSEDTKILELMNIKHLIQHYLLFMQILIE